MNYWILFIAVAVLSWLVSENMRRKFDKYSRIPLPGRLSGMQVAERMLEDNGITDVRVYYTLGNLSDHYNPLTRTINLSEEVFRSGTLASAAIAAHECGHALQHARSYAPLMLRSALVPVVNFSSKIVTWVLLGGMLALHSFPQLMLIGIGLFAVTTLFAFITLPVEINASRRAIQWLDQTGLTDASTHDMAVDALRSAAYTYVVAALGSLATLLYYVTLFTGSRRN